MNRGTTLCEAAAWRNGEGIYVSIQRAKLLVSGLRWHHLGFAFFWATTFAALTSSSEELVGGYESYSFCKQVVVVLTLAGQFWQVNLSQLMQDFLKHALDNGTNR